MQRNPHSYQIATGYRTFYSLSLIYQPITKKTIVSQKKSPLTVRFMYEQGTFTNKVSIHNRLDLINSSIS